ncbi:MAG: 8-oxo-dGTP pyrophosphatase MutT, NUDIX family [Chloroflexi bacterium]|nr:MAG: 8-oxo-dGTP pyrophosphatase MutT, NUDIX family [Chloroflexota bacterium]
MDYYGAVISGTAEETRSREDVRRLRRSLGWERGGAGVLDEGRRASAVLLVLLQGPSGELDILFTKRPSQMVHHGGEVCFVGGSSDPSDESLLATALREAQEEMGIVPEDVEVLGTLDTERPKTTPFVIQPFVGLLQAPYDFQPNASEIAEVLVVPLSVVQNPASFREEVWLKGGELERERYFAYGPHLIWGATARILGQFLNFLRDEDLTLAGGLYGG